MSQAAASPPGAPAAVTVRRLAAADAPAYRALMLDAYARHPDAFTSSWAERAPLPLAWWEQRLGGQASDDTSVWGAFVGPVLAGVAGLRQEPGERLRHKATLFGMAVAPMHRRSGLARTLVQAVLADAAQRPGLQLVQLTVSSHNEAALRLYQQLGFVAYAQEPLAVLLEGRAITKQCMMQLLNPPQDSLVLADSELSRVTASADGLLLQFSAASVWREQPDQPPLAGHLAAVSLQLLGPLPPLQLGDWQGRLADGRLLHQGRVMPRLRLPLDLHGELELQLRFAQGPELQMRAHRLLAQAAPGARFTESLAC